MRSQENADPFARAVDSRFNGYRINRRAQRRSRDVELFNADQTPRARAVSISSVNSRTLLVWMIVIACGLFALTVRAAYLQLDRGQYYGGVAEGNRIRIRDIKASRGVIYDRNQTLLVENVPNLSLALIPVDLPKDPTQLHDIILQAAHIASTTPEAISDTLATQSPYSYQPVTIAENLSNDQSVLVRILSSRYPGVTLSTSSIRHYLQTDQVSSLSHVLGYVGKIETNKLQDYLAKGYLIDDRIGKAGVEETYEDVLKGVNGKEQVEVDALGQAKDVLASEAPLPGNNLELSIDFDLQKVAEDSLAKTLQQYGRKRGTVIALDPRTGEVLAMVSLPSFNDNDFSTGINADEFSKLINDPNQPLYNRAISGEYPSGSTIKLVYGAAALQEGIITEQTTVNSVGGIHVGQWFFPDWKAGGHGITNIVKALAESVNTFFYEVGGGYQNFKGLGIGLMKTYANKFGLGSQLGIDLPNEASGFYPTEQWKETTKKQAWYIGDTYHAAIGQGDVLVTPLQVAAWTSVFASGGTLYKPHVVKAILDSNNKVINEIQPVILNQNFIDPRNIAIVNKGLRAGVVTGSSKRLSTLPIPIASKTGTAQWGENKSPHAWTTAFAPYDNPQIVLTVLVEEGQEGSQQAMSIAYDVFNWWIQNRYHK